MTPEYCPLCGSTEFEYDDFFESIDCPSCGTLRVELWPVGLDD